MLTIERINRILPALLLCSPITLFLSGCADPPEPFNPEAVSEVDLRKTRGGTMTPARRFVPTRESVIRIRSADPGRPFPEVGFQRFSGAFFAAIDGGKLVGSEHRLIIDADSFQKDTPAEVAGMIRAPQGLATGDFPNLTVSIESAEGSTGSSIQLTGNVEVRGARIPFQAPAQVVIEKDRLTLSTDLNVPLNGPDTRDATLLRQQAGNQLRLALLIVAEADEKPVTVSLKKAASRAPQSLPDRRPDDESGGSEITSSSMVSPENATAPTDRVARFIGTRDADQDGRLSPAEAGPFWEILSPSDTNGDSFLSPEELKTARLPVQTATPPKGPNPGTAN